ncbi:DUF389 domain-containing protein [Streptomyces sp. NA04227]|uniref:DUF389 domain-containing protein n=1 Tax=Streptomyces sp. NA04227 TaxID=2742136 RepID=UPI00159197A8|nr:DUF389 domain-containing protein [Streptomyces sp. NA04227]QKW08635.1 DUF389 domain-containing protein [Streptomyces sp. NA04227]
MLHMRVTCPAERTEDVVRLMESCVGTAHLAVYPGASRNPPGDIVNCDVAREAGEELIAGLRELDIPATGAVTMEHIDLTLSERADKAEEEAPGEAADAVLWEQLSEATHEESTLSVTYLAFMTIAMMIAACGVVLDNAILIVGAMAVGPEFGPLAGVSTALVRRAPRLAVRSLTALLVGFAAAMVATVVFSYFMDWVGLFSDTKLDAERPNTNFIYRPDWFSFVVAVLAGCAGTLSLTSSKSGALVGVAISVTTIPAAANAAVAFGFDDYEQAVGSSQQLLLNLFGIVLAGTCTLLAQKALWSNRFVRRARRRHGHFRPAPRQLPSEGNHFGHHDHPNHHRPGPPRHRD